MKSAREPLDESATPEVSSVVRANKRDASPIPLSIFIKDML